MQASPKIQGISIDRSINRLRDACSQNSDDERTPLLALHTLTMGCARSEQVDGLRSQQQLPMSDADGAASTDVPPTTHNDPASPVDTESYSRTCSDTAAPASAMVGDSDISAADEAPARKRENRLAVNSLMLASAARNFAISVRQKSEQEIWLLAYAGDFGAQARAQGMLESVAGEH